MANPDKRAVIITGASRGLGRETALRFGRAGDRVAVNYLKHEAGAKEVVDRIAQSGGEAFACRADVRNAADIDSLVSQVLGRWGRVDVLVNNAGLTRDGLAIRMAEEEWDDVLDTNLRGAFLCIRAAAKVMMKQHEGHIINISSIVGVQGREGQANYAASKAGLIGLTRTAAKELGRFNVKVNAVLPGYLPTDMGTELSDSIKDRILKENALRRVSDPKEVAEFISQLSVMNNVSGQVFNLDSRII